MHLFFCNGGSTYFFLFQSLPFCLLFCSNMNDLTLDNLEPNCDDGEKQAPSNRSSSNRRKVSLLTDDTVLTSIMSQKAGFCDDEGNYDFNERKGRALRRRLFLDVCKDAMEAERNLCKTGFS